MVANFDPNCSDIYTPLNQWIESKFANLQPLWPVAQALRFVGYAERFNSISKYKTRTYCRRETAYPVDVFVV